MTPSHPIQIEGLSKTYRRSDGTAIHAVQDLTLSVPTGQLFGFLGPNGAGKTTTIKMICGLVRPTAGRVRVAGHDVWRARPQAVRQIGAVLEGTRNVHWPLSPWNNLIYFGHLKGVSGRHLKDRAEVLLRELDLWDRRGDLVRTFSRGMQQKVAIACALIADPPIVLLDEPTLGLDVQAAQVVRGLIERLVREQGKTVVLTTHQLDLAEKLCDRVAIISRGRIIADQPVAALLDLFRTEYYEVQVQGEVSPETAAALGFNLGSRNGDAVLSGQISDPSRLYELLDRLRGMGLVLHAVQRVEPDLEEVFVRLVDTSAQEREDE